MKKTCLPVAVGCWLHASAASAEDGPTYALRLEIDLPVLGVAAAMAAAPFVRAETAPPWCAPRCDPGRINAFDRATAGVYRPGWSRVSDVALGALVAANLLTMTFDEGVGNALNDTVVVAQTLLLSGALASLTGAAVRRPRPLAYGDQAPEDERRAPNAALSFFSGHTTNAFAAAVVLHRTLARRHPGSPAPNIVLGGALAAAALVGAGRILSGYHFPTDVLVGAVVGSSAGVLVPALHGSGLALTPFASSDTAGISVRGSF